MPFGFNAAMTSVATLLHAGVLTEIALKVSEKNLMLQEHALN